MEYWKRRFQIFSTSRKKKNTIAAFSITDFTQEIISASKKPLRICKQYFQKEVGLLSALSAFLALAKQLCKS